MPQLGHPTVLHLCGRLSWVRRTYNRCPVPDIEPVKSPAEPMVRRLSAGGKWIRTVGPGGGPHFSEVGWDRPARWPEPDFDDRRGQVYHVPCRARSGNDINAGAPGLGKEANTGPRQPARFRALTRPVPGDSVPRLLICETPRSGRHHNYAIAHDLAYPPGHFVNRI